MSALDELRTRTNKRKVELRKQIKEKKKEVREPQKIKEEVLKTIGTFYIEPLASRPPLAFQENNKSFGEEINIGRRILTTLQCVAIVGK
jgi:hypothetical protein